MKPIFVMLIAAVILSPLSAQRLRSQNISGNQWSGQVRVHSDHKKVTVHETYLEIEEEVELAAYSPWNEPPTATQNALEIFGTFTLPTKSVITGALLWEGDHLLKAKLKSRPDAEQEYSDSVDHDWDWVPTPTDPMLIGLSQRGNGGNDIYDFKLFPVKWNSTRRLRLRYLVPSRIVNGVPRLEIPRVFVIASGNYQQQRPENYQLELKGAPGITSVKIVDGDNVLTRPLSDTPLLLTQSYNNMLYINRPELGTKGDIISTSIDGGELAGEYMHYYSAIPDELFLEAGLKREVVFLWRWENENSLVSWRNGYKYLSDYGYRAREQIYDIQRTSEKLLNGEAGVGMVLDRTGTERDTTFRIGYKGSNEVKKIFNFLNYLSDDYGEGLKNEIAGYNGESGSVGEELTDQERDSIARAGADDFEVVIDSIKTIFSPSDKVVKHVVVLTVGKRKTDENIVYTSSIEGLEGVTFGGYGSDSKFPHGYWPGVDMNQVVNDRYLRKSEIESRIAYPKTKEVNFTVYLGSTKKTQGFSLIGDGSTPYSDFISFTGHAAEMWKDSVLWYAQDKNGNELASFVQIPKRSDSMNDTNLVMLWGGSSASPYSETIKKESIGSLVGFVDEYYSLLAMPYDSVSKETQAELENGGDIGNLTEEEIIGPVAVADVTAVKQSGLYSVYNTFSGVEFALNIGNAKNALLVIYDLKGRVIMRFTHDQLVGKTALSWDGKGAGGRAVGTGMYIARLTMDGYSKSIKFLRN